MPGAYADLPPPPCATPASRPDRHRAALDRWERSWWRAVAWVYAILALGALVTWLRIG